MNRHALSLGLLVGLSAVVAATPSQAFTTHDHGHEYEIQLQQYDLFNHQSDAAQIERLSVENSLMRSFDGEWRVYSWNPQTGTPSAFYGSGVQVAEQLASQEEALGVARGIVNQNRDVFGANTNDLRVSSQRSGLGKRSVLFQQSYHGFDVIGGRVLTVFTESGRFFMGGSEYYSDITVDWRPNFPSGVAEDVAKRGLNFNPETDKVEAGTRLFILPVPTSETSVEHHLVYKVTLRTQEPFGKWVSYADAHDSEIVWRYNDIHYVNYTGDADGDVQEDTYCNGAESTPFKYLRVNVTGVGTTTTDINGNWTLANGDNTPRGVTADLYGPYVDLNNVAGAEAAFSGTATPGTPFNVLWNNTNSRADERDVFLAVNDVRDFMFQFDPTFSYINQRITANVGINDVCNAYWDGTINFFSAGGGCANTGEIQGVVHHEFGHGVQAAILGSQGNEGLGEGNADVLANLLTQESIIGRGFFEGNCVTGIRNSENSLRYPENVVGIEIHAAGQVIAGFHWDIMELLQTLHGFETGTIESAELWHFGRILSHPFTQPAQVLGTFVADDDNGNLSDGTPNYDVLCVAATNHGFSCPTLTQGITITHTPIATSTTEGDKLVTCTITNTGGTLVPAELYVDYRINGGSFVRVPLASGGPSTYTATIPNVQQPAEVEYYIHAANSLGQQRTNPLLAPTYVHSFDVALVYDTQEVANSWIVNPDGNDNASTGQWVRLDPNGTSAQPENDHTAAPGTQCWVTGNAPAGSGDGTADVDAGKTTLQTVGYDLSGAFSARVKYFRWFSNDAGANPGTDPWVVEVRNNGGAWQQIENTLTSYAGWLDISDDLVARFGGAIGTVELRFTARDNDPGSLVEAGIDDLEILADMDGSVDVTDPTPGAALRLALFGSAPNPARNSATIGFQVPAQTDIKITVYDVSGRAVRTLMNQSVAAGSHVTTWDGRDDSGRASASGVYYYRMTAPGFSATRSLILAK
ncbi:MAG: T9SS type A sorting domain-containing protein [Candidatus Eisenbacteria bacterium]|nr:T9SS type A sorting domain-containing protein [Candidatus Eisenbacteria bacterium]